jgi:hypothetical protein
MQVSSLWLDPMDEVSTSHNLTELMIKKLSQFDKVRWRVHRLSLEVVTAFSFPAILPINDALKFILV